VVRKLRKTLALSLAVLGMTSTLALAQSSNTTANTGSGNPYWNQSWNYVGSGGSNLGLRNGMNPYAAPLEPHGFNSPGADYSGYAVPPRS
jgi:nucleoside-specific outer membrane channel protein Tsx